MKRVLVNLTEEQLKELEVLVKDGIYASRTEAVRDSIRQLIGSKNGSRKKQ